MQDRFGRGWRLRRALAKLYSFILKYNWPSRIFTALVIDPPKIKSFMWGGYPLRGNVPGTYMNGWWFINGPSDFNEMPTVRFLGDDLRDGDVFWEVGSAWGCYALVVNRMAKIKQSVAFEPEALNYAETVRNVYINNFRNTLVFPVAASNTTRWADFYLQAFQVGYGGGMTDSYDRSNTEQGHQELGAISAGKAFNRVSEDGKILEGDYDPIDLAPDQDLPHFEWGEKALEMPLDALRSQADLEYPTHFVMDIGGGELSALEGMRDVLSHSNFRAASIEVDPTTEPAVEKLLAKYGIRKHIEKLPTQRRGNNIYVKGPDKRPST